MRFIDGGALGKHVARGVNVKTATRALETYLRYVHNNNNNVLLYVYNLPV